MRHLRSLVRRLLRAALGASVLTKILGIAVGLVLMMGLGTILQVRSTVSQALNRELQEQGVALGRDLAARSVDLILVNDLFALHRLMHDTLTNNADVRYAFVHDPAGRVLAHSFEGGFPRGLLGANSVLPDAHHRVQMLSTEEGLIWDIAVPIFGGRAGTARVGLSERLVKQALRDTIRRLMTTTILVALIGLSLGGLLTWVLTHPVRTLVHAAEVVGQGDLDHQVPIWAEDEIGALSRSFNAMTSELARAERERTERAQLRAQLLEKIMNAQEDERKRISRELHDSASQSLTSLNVGLQVLADSCTETNLHEYIADLQATTQSTLKNLRNLALQLRPHLLDDLGLVAALQRHIREFEERFGLRVDFEVMGLNQQRLPAPLETTLYRTIQEALTNVARHAHATNVSVLLERHNGHVRAIIEDDGQGFDTAQGMTDGHLGLYGMEERVTLVSGRLTIESDPGHGTSLFIELPVVEGAGEGEDTYTPG